jgi:alpha-amylase
MAALNTLRKHVIKADSKYLTTQSNVIYSDKNSLALSKGSAGSAIITVLSHFGDNSTSEQITVTNTGYTGKELTDVVSCSKYTTDSSGSVQVTILNGFPAALYPTDGLSGSSLCGTTGDKFANYTATTTMTTYTTTISGTPVATTATATLPVVNTTSTATDAASAADVASEAGMRAGINTVNPLGAIIAGSVVAGFALISFFGFVGV